MTVNMSAVTNYYELVEWANTQTSGLLGLTMIVGLFLGLFFGLGLYRQEKGFAVSAFASTIASFALSAGGFIPEQWSLVLIIITLVGVFLME